MQVILQNLALWLLIDFCKANGIDCAGTYIKKDGRGFTYSLRDQATGTRIIAQVTFHKNSVPTYAFNRPETETRAERINREVAARHRGVEIPF